MDSKSVVRALVPYSAKKQFRIGSRLLHAWSCLSRKANLYFQQHVRINCIGFLLFFFGYYIGCFWSAVFCFSGLDFIPKAIFQFFYLCSFLFSFGFLGVIFSPAFCFLHSFLIGSVFFTLDCFSSREVIALFLLSFFSLVFYCEAFSASVCAGKGYRPFFCRSNLSLLFVSFCVLEFLLICIF